MVVFGVANNYFVWYIVTTTPTRPKNLRHTRRDNIMFFDTFFLRAEDSFGFLAFWGDNVTGSLPTGRAMWLTWQKSTWQIIWQQSCNQSWYIRQVDRINVTTSSFCSPLGITGSFILNSKFQAVFKINWPKKSLIDVKLKPHFPK